MKPIGPSPLRAVGRRTIPAGSWLAAALVASQTSLPLSVAADEWTPVTLEGSADCAALASAPSLPSRYYLATAEGGVYRSDDRGDAWSLAMDGLPLDGDLRVLAVSPVDPDFVLLGGATGNPIHRSKDGGSTWSPASVLLEGFVTSALAFDPLGPDTVLAGGWSEKAGILRSTDSGETWDAPLPGTDATVLQLACHPSTTGLVLAAAEDGIHRSTDSGRSWTHVYSGARVPSLGWGPPGSDRAWGVAGADVVLRSDDAGLTFETIATIPSMGNMQRIRAHPVNPDHVIVGGGQNCGFFLSLGLVRETVDGGSTWPVVYESYCRSGPSPVIREILVEPGSPARLTVAIGGRISGYGRKGYGLHRNDGDGWVERVDGTLDLLVGHVETDLMGGLWFRGREIWHASAPSAPVTTRIEDPLAAYKRDVFVFRVSPTEPGVLHDGGYWAQFDVEGIWAKTSVDGATSYDWRPVWPAPFADGLLRSMVSAPGTPSRAYAWAAYYYGTDLYRSLDHGSTWVHVGQTSAVVDAAVDPGDNQRLFVLTEEPAGVQLSTDAGVTWTPRSTGLPSGTPLRIHLDSADSDHLLAVYETDGLWETTDAGLSWSELGTGPPAATIVASDWDAPAATAYLATEAQGVWITGHGWANDGLGTRRLEDIAYSVFHETVIVGTELFGAWRLPYPRGPVGVASLDAPGPTKLSLDARPNPFRRDVTLRFALPVAGPVRLEVLDVTGRRVRSVADGFRAAGAHRETWDARDDRGKRVGAGIYFARIAAGDEREVVRITLLR